MKIYGSNVVFVLVFKRKRRLISYLLLEIVDWSTPLF
jgi:hypothetical protein